MKSATEGVLEKWPVSKRVNSSRAPDDDASLIEAIDSQAKMKRRSGHPPNAFMSAAPPAYKAAPAPKPMIANTQGAS
jgi:hypothetical protein